MYNFTDSSILLSRKIFLIIFCKIVKLTIIVTQNVRKSVVMYLTLVKINKNV